MSKSHIVVSTGANYSLKQLKNSKSSFSIVCFNVGNSNIKAKLLYFIVFNEHDLSYFGAIVLLLNVILSKCVDSLNCSNETDI